MEELVTKHSAVMDQFDPDKKVGLMVDEWGTWYTGLPGSNPGFLHQQNSLRDALVAAIHFNIFSQHADRVKMANIAQMVNVLQAMILTNDEKMVLTPTYYTFEMYKPFMDATHLPLELAAPTIPAGRVRAFRLCTPRRPAARTARCTSRSRISTPKNAAAFDVKIAGVRCGAVGGQILDRLRDQLDQHVREARHA